MFAQVYYLLLAKADGQYLTAHPDSDNSTAYLLLFHEQFEALSYLNKFAGDLASRFAVESVTGSQMKGILQRWGFGGIALIKDPILPEIEFMILS
ncbi:MAG: hypothetical protein WBA13_14780 [Microcoleaceae cyanobacterium]